MGLGLWFKGGKIRLAVVTFGPGTLGVKAILLAILAVNHLPAPTYWLFWVALALSVADVVPIIEHWG